MLLDNSINDFSQNFKNNLSFQPLDFEHTWWKLIQERVMHTKFDIYVLLNTLDDMNYWLMK